MKREILMKKKKQKLQINYMSSNVTKNRINLVYEDTKKSI